MFQGTGAYPQITKVILVQRASSQQMPVIPRNQLIAQFYIMN